MELEIQEKINKEVSLKRAAKRVLEIIFFVIIGVVIGSMLLPDSGFVNKYRIYLYIAAAAVSVFEFYRVYHWFKKRLDCTAVIRDIISKEKNPVISLKKGVVRIDNQIEILQKKIDFCKIIFPTPFFTYWLGIYINKSHEANELLKKSISGVDIATGLLFASFIIVIIYGLSITKYFSQYVDNKFYLVEYKKALIECEENKG